ncbi:MAG: FAD/NAD(P)-binding oxidoreductase [Sediminibacterium sp.]|nr:FAD/NAD(P)-binding oxidoreductase [Sediminibacterium sp.]MDP3128291.1 FAD/NAD(P)-binding oxidoreductase [Sediminibacterium sp.]
MKPVILILGGGTGGLMTAHFLRKKLGSHCRIIVFEKEEKNVFAPSLLWLMVGKRKTKDVYRSTKQVVRKGIELVLGNIEKVNPENKSVQVNGKAYKGDYLIVSLGAAQQEVPALSKKGFDFFSLEGAAGFYDALQHFHGGKIAVLISSLPFKCPAAPYEAAMLIESAIRKRGLRDKTEIAVYSPETMPMPVAGKVLADAVKQMLENKGIKYFPEHQYTRADYPLLSFSNGNSFSYDLLAYTPKHICPDVIAEGPLTGKSGWIETNRETLETNFSNVYAIGDITFIPLELGKPLPKAGVFAHYQAEVVANNIAERINGGSKMKTFDGSGQCFLEMGDGKAGYAGGNFYGSPLPLVKMKKPGYWWHLTKVMFEKYWFFKYF